MIGLKKVESINIDGFICTDLTKSDSIYRPFIISDSLAIDENCVLYFETLDKLKLEIGKWYRTRDGRKACIFYHEDNEYHGCTMGSDEVTSWCENGLWYENEENDIDIVSEWSDDDGKEN